MRGKEIKKERLGARAWMYQNRYSSSYSYVSITFSGRRDFDPIIFFSRSSQCAHSVLHVPYPVHVPEQLQKTSASTVKMAG